MIRQISPLWLVNQVKANLQRTWLAFLPAVILLFLAVGCGTDTTPNPAISAKAESNTATPKSVASKIKVQATTTVLADMTRVIGGDMVEATSIVPAGADVHIYQVSPSQRIAISEANLLISNGLGLDDFLKPVLTNSNNPDVVHVVVSQGLTPKALEEISLSTNETHSGHHDEKLTDKVKHLIHDAEEGAITSEDAVEQIEKLLDGHEGAAKEHHEDAHGHGEDGLEDELKEIIHKVEDGHITAESAIDSMEQLIDQHHGEEGRKESEHHHDHDSGDPHFWLDPILATHYVEQISKGLIQVDPENAQVYSANADQYTQKLLDLDLEITKELSQVPSDHRHMITFHDAYGYFGRRYDWKVSSFVPGHAGDVTPQDIVRVLDNIKADGIPAVFAEPQFAEDVLQEAAQTAGVTVGVIRSLVDGTEPTYIAMMRSNVRTLVEYLK